MIKNISFVVLLIFCLTFVYPSEAKADKGTSMFWGIVCTLGAVGCMGGMVSTAGIEDDNSFVWYLFGTILFGALAVWQFNEALEYRSPALFNIERDKFFFSIPDVSYSISEKEGTAPLFKYSF